MEIFSDSNSYLNLEKNSDKDFFGRNPKTSDPKKVDDPADKREYLAFILSGEEYGIDIMMIKEIVIPTDLTWVPRVPEFVQGIISLRGSILPILDLKPMLQLRGEYLGDKRRIIVVSIENEGVGLMVDEVTGVIKLADSEVLPPPETLSKKGSSYFRGVGKYKERFIIIMDIQSILLNTGVSVANG